MADWPSARVIPHKYNNINEMILPWYCLNWIGTQIQIQHICLYVLWGLDQKRKWQLTTQFHSTTKRRTWNNGFCTPNQHVSNLFKIHCLWILNGFVLSNSSQITWAITPKIPCVNPLAGGRSCTGEDDTNAGNCTERGGNGASGKCQSTESLTLTENSHRLNEISLIHHNLKRIILIIKMI